MGIISMEVHVLIHALRANFRILSIKLAKIVMLGVKVVYKDLIRPVEAVIPISIYFKLPVKIYVPMGRIQIL